MYKSGNRFLVASLMTGREREVHVSDIRAISPPQDEQQRQEWTEIVSLEMEKTVFDAAERERVFKRFWAAVDYPQAKRRCRTRSFEGDDKVPDDA
jgi:hypothetical protein